MKSYLHVLVAIFALNSTSWSAVERTELSVLLLRLDQENSENRISQYSLDSKDENVRAAQSLLLPNLSFSTGVSKSRAITVRTADMQTSSGDSQSSELGLPETYTRATEGWVSQFSSTYYLFAHTAIKRSIQNAEISVLSGELDYEQAKISKRSQFIQTLLEWQWLKKMVKPLETAKAIVEKTKTYVKERSNILYSEDDRTEIRQRQQEVELYQIKVSEGAHLAEVALKDMLPSVSTEELEGLGQLEVSYNLPEESSVQSRYLAQSADKQIQDNDVKIAENNVAVARLKRPWIPVVAITAGLSNYGGYDGKNTGNSWNTQLLMNFNLFDGAYTDSRRVQANLSLMIAEEKRNLQLSKSHLLLRARRMKAVVARSEYELKKTLSSRKLLQLQDVQEKVRRGISTQLEESLATLQYTKSTLEALESLKDYQSAALAIAVDLNEWEKVNVSEK